MVWRQLRTKRPPDRLAIAARAAVDLLDRAARRSACGGSPPTAPHRPTPPSLTELGLKARSERATGAKGGRFQPAERENSGGRHRPNRWCTCRCPIPVQIGRLGRPAPKIPAHLHDSNCGARPNRTQEVAGSSPAIWPGSCTAEAADGSTRTVDGVVGDVERRVTGISHCRSGDDSVFSGVQPAR